MAKENKNTVDSPCSAYTAMQSHWDLIDDLLGGTLAMRAAGEKWLPKEPKEENQAWQNRLDRSILYGAYSDTVDDLVGRPFSKPVTIQGKLPEQLASLEDNCDGQGTDFTQFARELFYTCLSRGLTHVLIDYPKTTREDGKKLTLAQEKQTGVRPIFVHIRPQQLIGWRYEKGLDGKPKLIQIRWKETHSEPDGEFGTKEVETIRVYTTDGWQIHTKNDKEYVLTEEGTHTYPDGIPLVTCYVNKDGFMTAQPPLEGLAWLNLAHWQSYSDQRNILRFARAALLFAKGLTDEEMEKEVVLGPSRMFRSTNSEADMKFVEHTGKAIEAGRQDLLDLEERMTVLGLEPLLSRPGNQTATGQSIDEAKSQSSIQAWIRSLELALYNAIVIAAKWTGETLSDDFTIDIYNDFGVSIRATADIEALIKMRQAGEIDRETFLREVKRRALLSEATDIEEVISRIEAEGPSLGLLRDEDETSE